MKICLYPDNHGLKKTSALLQYPSLFPAATSFASGPGAKQPVSVAEVLAQGLDASRPGRAELQQSQRDAVAMCQETPDPRDMPSARSSLRTQLISLARTI